MNKRSENSGIELLGEYPDLPETPSISPSMVHNLLSAPKPIGGNTATPQNFNLDEGIVKAFNQGTGNDQVNEVTGLTYVEDSLLKPWEKAYRIKQNQKRT